MHVEQPGSTSTADLDTAGRPGEARAGEMRHTRG